MNLRTLALATVSLAAVLPSLGACTAIMTDSTGSGGAAAGGTASGGGGTGGGGSGGAPSGGAPAGGGPAAGGASGGASGGSATGGTGGQGTGGSGDWRDEDWDAVPIGPTFQYVRKITASWQPTCVGADCHGGTPAHVNLIPNEGLYERLTTGVSNDVCLDENGMPMRYVVPGEPENSAFLRILREDCENHARMPDGCQDPGDCLSAMYTDPVEEWIANGAPETETGGGSGGSTGSGGAGTGGATP